MIVQIKWNGENKDLRKSGVFDQYLFISNTVQDTSILTMEDKQELICVLSNGLEWSVTFSRSRYYSSSNNSKMV